MGQHHGLQLCPDPFRLPRDDQLMGITHQSAQHKNAANGRCDLNHHGKGCPLMDLVKHRAHQIRQATGRSPLGRHQ